MRKYTALFLLVLSSALLGGCAKVPPGYVGIQINMLGKDRGVDSVTKVSGLVTYNFFTTSILEYPTFVQTAVWTKDKNEGSPNNEEITFNSKEGLNISGDISLSYQLNPEKVPAFYVKFRSDDLTHFTHGFLRNIARDAFNETASTMAVEDIYGPKKEELLAKVRARINKEVTLYGVELQQFGFIGSPRLPDTVKGAIDAKIKATQDAIRVENELRQATAEAQKRIAAAEGEARSNEILTKSLSPVLLEWRKLEISETSVKKWNGALPQYMAGSQPPFVTLPVK